MDKETGLNLLKKKFKCIESARKGLSSTDESEYTRESNFNEKYHYTSLPILFSILDNDSLWISSSRFSNDESEEKLLGDEWIQDNSYQGDNYIFCTCSNGDQLSQWRGYCPNGGASIQLDLYTPHEFSILHADYNESKKYEKSINAAIPVFYAERGQDALQVVDALRNNLSDGLSINEMIPFLKNGKFHEECESRMVFGNMKGELSKCIRFRTLRDGSMVPYMVIKANNVADDLSICTLDFSDKVIDAFIDDKVSKLVQNIFIPQGSNQEAVYYAVYEKIEAINKERGETTKFRIFCEGHLPILKIITAPTYNRERIAEKIKRYCKSKYWLRDVIIESSTIPYIPPSE